jgi:hypothetical protein
MDKALIRKDLNKQKHTEVDKESEEQPMTFVVPGS